MTRHYDRKDTRKKSHSKKYWERVDHTTQRDTFFKNNQTQTVFYFKEDDDQRCGNRHIRRLAKAMDKSKDKYCIQKLDFSKRLMLYNYCASKNNHMRTNGISIRQIISENSTLNSKGNVVRIRLKNVYNVPMRSTNTISGEETLYISYKLVYEETTTTIHTQ